MAYFTHKGCQLHYQVHGSGEPLLLIHGLGSSLRDWEYQVPFLAEHYQVICMDVRGHGQSDKPASVTASPALPTTYAPYSTTCNSPKCITWASPWAA